MNIQKLKLYLNEMRAILPTIFQLSVYGIIIVATIVIVVQYKLRFSRHVLLVDVALVSHSSQISLPLPF